MTSKPSSPAVAGGGSIVRDGFRLEARRNDEKTLLPVTQEREGYKLSIPQGVEATLLEIYRSQKPEPYATQSKILVSLAPGAQLTHYKLVLEGTHADHYSFLEVDGGKDSGFFSNVFLMGGAQIRNTIQVRLTGENAQCVLNGLYVGKDKQKIETHTIIDHQKPHGTSREFYKGILDDQAQGIFDGLVIVAKDAQKTDSAQTNKNLLLSPKAHAHSVPELKILANDVKCKHGSTIGQLDPQQLFYLQSRGIPTAEARKLLIYAFASEMIDMVDHEEVRSYLIPCLSLTTSIKK